MSETKIKVFCDCGVSHNGQGADYASKQLEQIENSFIDTPHSKHETLEDCKEYLYRDFLREAGTTEEFTPREDWENGDIFGMLSWSEEWEESTQASECYKRMFGSVNEQA